ncbi:hypothetical protein IKP13_09080, partial [bacterium]|nr:hypothetical protein [bacterium]
NEHIQEAVAEYNNRNTDTPINYTNISDVKKIDFMIWPYWKTKVSKGFMKPLAQNDVNENYIVSVDCNQNIENTLDHIWNQPLDNRFLLVIGNIQTLNNLRRIRGLANRKIRSRRTKNNKRFYKIFFLR